MKEKKTHSKGVNATTPGGVIHVEWTMIIGIVVAIVVMTTTVAVFMMRYGGSEAAYQYQLRDGWTLYDGVTTTEGVTIQDFVLDHRLKRGETVILSTTLPEDIPWGSMVRMESAYSTVDVFVGERHIYSFGQESYQAGDFVGSGVHFIDLPDNSAGKEIQIVLVCGESNILNTFYPVEILPVEDAYFEFGAKRVIVAAVGIFLVGLGALGLVFGLVICLTSRRNQIITIVGGASFLLGVWTLCVTKTLELFTLNYNLISEAEHISLFLLPVPILLIIFENTTNLSKVRKMMIEIPVVVLLLFFITAMGLHYSNVAHFPRILSLFHLLVALSLASALLATVGRRFEFNRTHLIITVGLAELVVCGVVEILRYNMQKYFFAGGNNYSVTVLPFGMVAFIATIVIAYYVQAYEETMRRVERETWHKMAYTDALTMIGNRAKAEEAFRECDEGEKPFHLLSIDLNNLKVTNDTYGHEAGDNLLKVFAELLQKNFEDNLVSRMGGDEFLVLSFERRDKIEERLEKLLADGKEASEKLPYPLEFAYGLAGSDEVPGQKSEAVYSTADKRMYEKKKQMKSSRL